MAPFEHPLLRAIAIALGKETEKQTISDMVQQTDSADEDAL
jgi:hypothetical protein